MPLRGQLRGQLGVGHAARRQVAAGAGDARNSVVSDAVMQRLGAGVAGSPPAAAARQRLQRVGDAVLHAFEQLVARRIISPRSAPARRRRRRPSRGS